MARRSVLLLVAALIALVGTSLIVLYVKGIDARATEGQEMVEVLTATGTIEIGEGAVDAQEAGKFEKSQIRRDDVVEGSLTSTSSITDDVALATIYPGEQILEAKFGNLTEIDNLVIPDDKLAVSVELTDPERVAGFVSPGSEVAIFVSADAEVTLPGGKEDEAPFTRLLLPKIEVIGVGTTSVSSKTTTDEEGAEVTEEVPRTILTVAVSQKEAEKLIFASRNGDVSFALRNKDAKVSDQPGVSSKDILPELFAAAQ